MVLKTRPPSITPRAPTARRIALTPKRSVGSEDVDGVRKAPSELMPGLFSICPEKESWRPASENPQ